VAPGIAVAAAVVLAMTSAPRRAVADSNAADIAERNEKCATRLYTAMVGEGATTDALSSSNPQAAFDTLVQDERFQERFARFINSQFNNIPGATPAEDAAYYMTKYVLTEKKPWSEMFVGHLDVAPQDSTKPNSEAVVSDNDEGLGYFASKAWYSRYAGNEPAGIRIQAAYRMMQNTIGLTLVATTNAPDADITANGRKAQPCAGCHYDPWFALDKVASVLGKRTGSGTNTKIDTSAVTTQTLLGGVSISNERELVEALVANEAFDVNACRLAFKYLYGRSEQSCEGPLFDTCVDAFKKDKTITTALAVIAKDPSFCE
jgi:hypothetical protein